MILLILHNNTMNPVKQHIQKSDCFQNVMRVIYLLYENLLSF